MGWMGREQVRLLLESGGLGLLLGMLFDVFGALSRACGRRRIRRFLVDAAFGIPAALMTFYGALAIMDGRMHPLLFGGMLVGFCLQHLTIGRRGCRLLYRVGSGVSRGIRAVCRMADAGAERLGKSVATRLRRPRPERDRTVAPKMENVKKNHFFMNFFEKKP